MLKIEMGSGLIPDHNHSRPCACRKVGNRKASMRSIWYHCLPSFLGQASQGAGGIMRQSRHFHDWHLPWLLILYKQSQTLVLTSMNVYTYPDLGHCKGHSSRSFPANMAAYLRYIELFNAFSSSSVNYL